jgi:hypothetical protein
MALIPTVFRRSDSLDGLKQLDRISGVATKRIISAGGR